MAMAQGYTKEQVESILDDFEKSGLIDQKTKGLLRYAEKITRKPHEITKEDITDLKELGLDDVEILEGVYIASAFNMIDRIADALGTPVDNFVESMTKG
jgi:alkylhydroperoxidase family enzyme